ncbi:DUF433 domain-containing protein [Frankia sp. Cas3]|uniref:DUF433 domain-containing protein n=1 Tax=Frankia sp. Cas3 TaxID=3073926 RepID=UPI002AD4FA52|nr:DUF433 domain-containing protein [Frankia sp. Cas3]
MSTTAADDVRLTVPLYTVAEAARYLALKRTTFATWARGYVRRPEGRRAVTKEAVVTSLRPAHKNGPSVPFVGLTEGMVLAAFRQAHVPLQQIRPALDFLRAEVDIEHALASRRLYLVGAELLWDYAHHNDADPLAARRALELVSLRSGQRVFTEVVQRYLRLITYADDDLGERVQLPGYDTALIAVDPQMNFGRPYFLHSGVRVETVLRRHQAGESIEDLTDDYGIQLDEIADAIDVAARYTA